MVEQRIRNAWVGGSIPLGGSMRNAGTLLHITSLPQRNLGSGSEEFIDWLQESQQKVWQILPLNALRDNPCPYNSISAFAGHIGLLDTQELVSIGLLEKEIEIYPSYRDHLLLFEKKILENLNPDLSQFMKPVEAFEKLNPWLEEYADFVAGKEEHGKKTWWKWPKALRNREPKALEQLREKHKELICKTKVLQWCFFQQAQNLRALCEKKGIELWGDIPYYISGDSADVWAHPELFKLHPETREALFFSGAPPDSFAPTGQLWGTPVYAWDNHIATGFDWWIKRVSTSLTYCHRLRFDHFRGLEAYWETPCPAATAEHGYWVKAPGKEFLSALEGSLARPLHSVMFAEDLGDIDDPVITLKNHFHLDGMNVLQFAFDLNSLSPHLPHNHITRSISYTGTHDNNTTLGWWQKNATPIMKNKLMRYGGFKHPIRKDIVDIMIRMTLGSVSTTAIIPMQDWLQLDHQHRMNIPGTVRGNWLWSLPHLDPHLPKKIKEMLTDYARCHVEVDSLAL